MNRLKKLRQEKGLSQKALTEMLNDKSDFTVTLRTVQNWEANKTPIKSAPAQILADYFGVTVPYLLGYHEETIAFKFPSDEEGFYKETQKLIDMAENIEQDSEIYSQVQQVKDMAILVRSSREKIKARYSQKVYDVLSDKETDVEFYRYLNFLLDKKEYLKSDLLVYLSLLDSSDKEIIFKMITEFKKQ
ncbi:TPA: helix-turn-helix transcriptional regulator [Streptococcus pneumoniae]|jgi:phage transcriptional regulator|nr:helix-turn-helix transcriptional regulator [Streptococcus pneumoniae]